MQDVGYLFNVTPPTGKRFEYKARFIGLPSNTKTETAVTWANEEKPAAVGEAERYSVISLLPYATRRTPRPNGTVLRFDVPQLENNRIYAVQIVRRTENSNELSSQNGTLRINEAAQLASNYTNRLLYQTAGSNITIKQRIADKKNLGTAVASNEKLLYVFFFRTSAQNTFASRLSAISLGRGISEPATVRSAQSGAQALMTINVPVSGSELFDPAEVEFQTIRYNTLEYAILPLVMIDAATLGSGWHTSFTNPLLYNELSWLRSRFGFVTPNVSVSYFRQNNWSGALTPWRVSLESAYANPLGANEISSVSMQNVAVNRMLATLSSSILSSIPSSALSTSHLIGLLGGNSNATSGYAIQFNHGLLVPLDFDELKRGAVTTILRNTFPNNQLTSAESSRLSAITGRMYNPPAGGTYQFDFKYMPPIPTSCAISSENSGVGIINRQFDFGTVGVAPR